MRAWQDTDLDGDLAHVLEAAAIRAHPLFDDALADTVLDRLGEQLVEDVGVLREALAQLGDGALAQLVDRGLAGGFVRIERGRIQPKGEVLADHLDDLGWKWRGGVLELRLADLALQLELPRAHLLVPPVGHLDRLEDDQLRRAPTPPSHPDDGVRRPSVAQT